MIDVVYRKLKLGIKFFLSGYWKSFVIFFKDFGPEDLHLLRSARKSSVDLNDFVFPDAISSSASASDCDREGGSWVLGVRC